MVIILLKRDSKNAIRFVKLDNRELPGCYEIARSSGLVGGTEVFQPSLWIKAGKAKRTLKEQWELELNSITTKYKAKGYKDLRTLTTIPFEELTQEYLQKIMPTDVTDEHDQVKPMLAKATDNAKPSVFERHWFASSKLDGVRCIIYWDAEKQEIGTSSRGGKHYNASTTHIRSNPKLIKLLSQRQYLRLDGELYHHGVGLESLSGTARLKEWSNRCEVLQFHCYDLAIPDLDFQHRHELLEKLEGYFLDEPFIKIVKHYPVHGYDEAKAYHDTWVAQGYEGAIIRDPVKEYGFNKRDNRMLKIKEFRDDEFEIIGYTLGLRGSEDMVFNLKTKQGVEFEAKPMGDRALKQKYVDDFDNIIGKKGTVKYFYMSPDGKPFLPVFKCIRNYE